jgi:ferrous iron transport protein A
MMPLGLLSPGEHGEITEIKTQTGEFCTKSRGELGTQCDTRAEEMGLRVGKRVEMLKNYAGLVLLKIDESRIALDRSLAMNILIKEVRQ